MGATGGIVLQAHRQAVLDSVLEYLYNQDGVASGAISPESALPAPDILIYTNECQTFHILPWLAGMEGQPWLRMLEMHWCNEAVQNHDTVQARLQHAQEEMRKQFEQQKRT